MNARELLDDLESGLIDEFMSAEVKAIYIRALRLLAAAESNDGTTKETDALIRFEFGETGQPFPAHALLAMMQLTRRLELERNGLAAKVVELEPDADRYRWLRDEMKLTIGHSSNIDDPDTLDFMVDFERAGRDEALRIDAARSKP